MRENSLDGIIYDEEISVETARALLDNPELVGDHLTCKLITSAAHTVVTVFNNETGARMEYPLEDYSEPPSEESVKEKYKEVFGESEIKSFNKDFIRTILYIAILCIIFMLIGYALNYFKVVI